ncbi:phage tail protein [Variovorax sp. S2]|uniref:phage tail protein n=1 Tax=Variovorax sp. S12S4 TaxID=3029170 RepID=UPI00215CE0CE|nr:phage tail protein [Variovorax sp. S12S4]MCR8961136.1 phage tail protein [Variovorax sp. S12S4]
MPQAIVGIIGYVAGAVAGSTLVAYAVSLVGTLALSMQQKKKADRLARAQFDAAQVDRLANVPGTIAPRELVLGRVRKGGHVFYRASVGQYKELFIMCVALAAHEIDGIEQIYFNDQPVDLDENGKVTTAPYGVASKISAQQVLPGPVTALDHTPIEGGATVRVDRVFLGGGGRTEVTAFTVSGNVVTITEDMSSEWPLPPKIYTAYYQYPGFNSFANVRWHLGSPGQAADDALIQQLGGAWTAAHRAAGVAYLVCSFAYSDTAFPSGIPNVTVRMRGAKVYDPRDGVTRFTENPSLLMRHVILHPQFGKRTTLEPSETARIIAAANACDTATNYTGGVVVPMYRAGCVFPFGAAPRDVLDDLSQAMGGEWAYAAGEYFVRAGVYQLPVMHLTDADLSVVQRSNDGSVSQNPVSISPHRPRNDKVNTVAIRIWDEAANYVQTPIPPFRADALVADDGAELSQEMTMPAVFYAGQAYHIAGIYLRDSRDPLTTTLSFKMSAYPLELFDSVTLTLSRYGWTAKEFRIMSRTFLPDGRVQLMLKETTAAIFALGAPFVPGGYAPNTGLPKPWELTPPVIVSIQSGESELIVQTDGTIVNGVRVSWEPILDASILNGGSVELQYMVISSAGPWVSVIVPGTATEAKFSGVPDGAWLLIRARTRNSLAESDWGIQSLHRVVGKTEPPPDIEGLSISGSVLSWTLPRRVPDLAGFVFRFHYGNNLDWNSAAPLHTGVLTESPYDLITRPGGLVTIMGKALDTSGNESRATANIIMNLGDPPIANIVEQFDFRALGWPASQLYLPQDDYLLLDGAGNFLTDQDGNFLTTGFGPLLQTEQYGWSEIDGVLQADALDSFYGDDNQTFYGADLDSFYEIGTYSRMVYVTGEFTVVAALAGSIMTLFHTTQGVDLRIDYRLAGPGSFYGADNQSFYGADAAPFYGPPGAWQPWPGQLVVHNDAYQFRVTIGGGTIRGILYELIAIIDAPDMEETLQDVLIGLAGTTIPYTKPFSSIKTIQATLQANASGAVTVETDKTNPLAPKIRAFTDAHALVGGATADITLKGY